MGGEADDAGIGDDAHHGDDVDNLLLAPDICSALKFGAASQGPRSSPMLYTTNTAGITGRPTATIATYPS